jgi:glycerophosphoryl diester phosphodiesterase
MTQAQSPWPYPALIAHRGAGVLAPENTLAAFDLGARCGYRMFECDVQLSADGMPFLLHDSTLTRTTNHREAMGPGSDPLAAAHNWEALSRLDAGSWLAPAFAGETLPSLQTVAQWCQSRHLLLNIEIKPSPGTAARTGEVVARTASKLWQGAPVSPLLSSFEVPALLAARQAAPHLPRAWLLNAMPAHWLQTATDLGCVAVVCEHGLWTQEAVDAIHRAGLHAMSFTVNTAGDLARQLALGVDAVITDRVDQFRPDGPPP